MTGARAAGSSSVHVAAHPPAPTPMRRLAVVPAALALAVAACSPGESVLGAERIAGDDAVAGGAWVLRRVGDALVPTRTHESRDGWGEVLADTLRFDAASVSRSGATRIVAYGGAAPHDSVYTQRFSMRYRIVDGQVRIGEPPCGSPQELILCAPADTGRVRGDTLVLAPEAPDQVRRAYVRVAAP